jgi:hypothetical protein
MLLVTRFKLGNIINKPCPYWPTFVPWHFGRTKSPTDQLWFFFGHVVAYARWATRSRLLEGQFILVLPLTIDNVTTELNLSFFWSITKGMGWPCYWTGRLKIMCGRALSLKGRAKSLSDYSLAYTDKQFALCEPFQKNLWTVPVQ